MQAGHIVDPLGLQQILREAIQQKGAQLISSSVSHFDTSDSQVRKIITTDGEHDVDHIVIAAGSGSASLARKMDSNVPMIPGVGFSVELTDANVSLHAPMLFMTQGIAVTPTCAGIRVAGLVSIGGSARRDHQRQYERLLKFAKSLFTGLEYKSVVRHTGARFQNAWFNFGHGHWGMTQASTSAKFLANLFEHKFPSTTTNPFSASRF